MDELNNLEKDYDRLSADGSKPSNTLVTNYYFTTKSVSRKMTMLASTAIRFKPSVIVTIGLIVNSEHTGPCVSQSYIETHGARTSEEPLHFVDCRVFRAFLLLQCLFGSTSFMNTKTDMEYIVQVNYLFQVQNLFRLNVFRTVQHTDVSDQFVAAFAALR